MSTTLPRNSGEENEIFFKTFLLQQKSNGIPVKGFGVIESLDFGPTFDVPEWLPEYSVFLSERNYNALKDIFPKAPANYKADVDINGKRYSVKFSGAAKAAIVNHTNRKGFLRVCEHLDISIEPLDSIISDYWTKRELGTIKEDVSNTDAESPFKDHKEYLKDILKYFLFEGTGSKNSEFQADLVLEFSDATNPESYNIFTREDVIDYMWDTLVFSLRSKKGMPISYDPDINSELVPWVRYRPGDEFPKGALHIRN